MIETPGEPAPGKAQRRSTAPLRLNKPTGPPRKTNKLAGFVKREYQRKDELGTARLGILATVGVALLGAVTTIVVTLAGSVNARFQSSEEFRRDQQQKAYAEFLASASTLDAAEVGLWATASLPALNQDGSDELKTVADASTDLALKLAVVRLIAPPDTAYNAVAVLNVLTRKGIVAARALDVPGGPSTDAEKQYEDIYREYNDLTEEFLASGRQDLD